MSFSELNSCFMSSQYVVNAFSIIFFCMSWRHTGRIGAVAMRNCALASTIFVPLKVKEMQFDDNYSCLEEEQRSNIFNLDFMAKNGLLCSRTVCTALG